MVNDVDVAAPQANFHSLEASQLPDDSNDHRHSVGSLEQPKFACPPSGGFEGHDHPRSTREKSVCSESDHGRNLQRTQELDDPMDIDLSSTNVGGQERPYRSTDSPARDEAGILVEDAGVPKAFPSPSGSSREVLARSNDMVYDHPRSCAGVKADAMSDIRRHINRAHRPVFLKLCKTCNEDILSEAEYESYHGAHCKNVQQQRRGNSEAQKTQWNNLYRKLFPNESMLPGPYNERVKPITFEANTIAEERPTESEYSPMSQPSGLASASNPTSSGGLEMRCEPGNRQLELLRAQDGNQVEIHSNVFGKQTSTMMSGTVRLMARSIRELLLSFPTEKQPDAKKFIESELRRILDADGKETTGQHQSSGFGEVSSPTLSESSVSRDLHPGTSSLELSRYLGSPNRTIVQAKDDPSTFGWENQARSNFSSEEMSEDPLLCDMEGCGAKFTGEYRRGNYGRHKRTQHGGHTGGTKNYTCEEPGCKKVFRRQDARLKHYRKHHPNSLGTTKIARSRTFSNSSRAASPDRMEK